MLHLTGESDVKFGLSNYFDKYSELWFYCEVFVTTARPDHYWVFYLRCLICVVSIVKEQVNGYKLH